MKSLLATRDTSCEERRARQPGLAAVMGWAAVVLLCWAGLSQAATYQLQAASLPEHVFRYFLEQQTLPHIEAFLDSRRAKLVMFGDRQPQPLGLMTAGESELVPLDVALYRPSHPWAAAAWSGETGQLAVFRVRGKASHYQKLKRVAVQTTRRMTQPPLRRVPALPSTRAFVPATSAAHLAHALENGMLESLTGRLSPSGDGLSVVVGQHSGPHQADSVYLVMRMPKDDQTYKVLLGWQGSGSRGRGGAG